VEELLKPISAKIPESLLKDLDNKINQGFADNRSELVREALERYINQLNGATPPKSIDDKVSYLENQVNALAAQVDSINQRLESQVDQLSSLLKRIAYRSDSHLLIERKINFGGFVANNHFTQNAKNRVYHFWQMYNLQIFLIDWDDLNGIYDQSETLEELIHRKVVDELQFR